MLEVNNLSFSFGNKSIFNDLTCSFAQEKIHAIIGHSGCGKTTLLYLLSGLYQPGQGSVCLGGINLSPPGGERAIILQDYGLLPWKRVRDNIALSLEIKHVPKAEQMQLVNAMMDELGIAHLAMQYPSQLSGGEKQRCAIARALVCKPKLLLMDQPFSALDAINREKLQELLLKIQRRHSMTVLVVTHSIEEAVYLSDEIHLMKKTESGSTFVPALRNDQTTRTSSYRTCDEYWQLCVQLRQLFGEAEA